MRIHKFRPGFFQQEVFFPPQNKTIPGCFFYSWMENNRGRVGKNVEEYGNNSFIIVLEVQRLQKNKCFHPTSTIVEESRYVFKT